MIQISSRRTFLRRALAAAAGGAACCATALWWIAPGRTALRRLAACSPIRLRVRPFDRTMLYRDHDLAG